LAELRAKQPLEPFAQRAAAHFGWDARSREMDDELELIVGRK
jgi:hypothetical protein